MNIKTKYQTKLLIKKSFQDEIHDKFKMVTDPLFYPKIHPLITHVNQISNDQYECFETTSVLGIPYNFKYMVHITHRHPNLVIMQSEVQRGVYIKLSFSMNKSKNEQIVNDEIEIKGSFLVRKILAHKIKKAHNKMFANIQEIACQSTNFN